jgi:4-amino-4-deoxychorismate lyase
LRISYDIKSNSGLSKIEAYKAKEINSLKLIELKEESYMHKFEDREFINSFYEKRGNASDVLFYRNNKILDTSYCNIAFFNGKEWLTPKIPLLKGTMREQLINKGIIVEKDIPLEDIQNFKKARLFNAMILWSDKKELSNFYT